MKNDKKKKKPKKVYRKGRKTKNRVSIVGKKSEETDKEYNIFKNEKKTKRMEKTLKKYKKKRQVGKKSNK